MWCSRGCLATPAISDAWLCHVNIAGGARRRGCAAGGVSVKINGLLVEDYRLPVVDEGRVATTDRRMALAGARCRVWQAGVERIHVRQSGGRGVVEAGRATPAREAIAGHAAADLHDVRYVVEVVVVRAIEDAVAVGVGVPRGRAGVLDRVLA